jgi:ATP-dependent exoDNAse (exonuclease V) beta subunit
MSQVALTPEQLDAVDVSKRHIDACIVAGPGSGKTTVLVEYFRRLVEAGVDPLRILAITFTEKAAGNMRKKLGEAFQDDSALRAKLERAWVFTVHGFCSRLLHESAVWAGVDPEFTVADARDAYRLQRESMDEAMEEAFQSDAAAVRALIRGLSSPDFEEAVLSAYDAIRGAGMTIDQVEALPAPDGDAISGVESLIESLRLDPLTTWSYAQKQHLQEIIESAQRIVSAETPRDALAELENFPAKLNRCKRGTQAYALVKLLKDDKLKHLKYALITAHHAPQRDLLFAILRRFDRIYRAHKRSAGSLDFADLEEYAVRLLAENSEARARMQAQFDHVLMDEFQDTNGQQAELLRLVRPPDRFYAVGDINQSIFGFRHAEPQGFQQYRDAIESGGKHLVNLAGNFRSRAEILSAIETITAGAGGIEPRSLVAQRTFEQPRPVAVEVIGVIAEAAAPGLRMEAQCVAGRILDLLRDSPQFSFKDVAVLVRNTEVFGAIAAAFDRAGIPYLINSGRGFYEAREVNDLVHLLRVIANPRDEISLAAVLRSPLVEVSDEALLRLRILDRNLSDALRRLAPENAADFGEDYARLTRFRDRLHAWRIRRESVTFDRLLLAALDDCGYRPETGARGAANIDKFLAQARDAASRETLSQFVEELSRVRDLNPREQDTAPEDSADSVKVMTVHSAKGLEFPIVFVAAMHKGVENNLPVVAFSPRIGLGARWRNPARREDKNDQFQHAIHQERKVREMEESHRLLYVAMSRAEQHLVLSFIGGKTKEWAKVVAKSLHLDTETSRDEAVSMTAPDGKPWNLRVQITSAAPELLHNPRPPAQLEDLVELLPAPPIDGQQDANATVTALSKFAKCPREYHLAHYLGFEGRRRKLRPIDDDDDEEEDDDLPADEIGSQVHALLAGAAAEQVISLAISQPVREALRLAEVFRQSPLGRRVAQATRVEREFDFLMSVEDLVIRGQIDLWFEEGGQLTIVDYKTDSVTAAEARQRAQDYSLQLKLYALAVERIAGRPPDHAWLHFLRPDKAIEVDLAPSLLGSPQQIVREFQEAQSKQEFPMNIGEHCRRCQFYKDLCPAG